MARFVLVNHGDDEYVLGESTLPNEARLHDALELHPDLFPAEDLNLGQLMVVGREVAFESGSADLIYLDEGGEIVIVEVKKGTENPDSRRVVAQMLDYGAHLWQMTYDDFEARIVLPYLRKRARSSTVLTSLLDAAVEQFTFGDTTTPDEFVARVSANLQSGTFTYVVVARTLPPTLGTVLRYLAEVSSIQTAAITVDYFRDAPRDLLVPHVAFASTVKPSAKAAPKTKATPEAFLRDVEDAAPVWERILEFLSGLSGTLLWGDKGFTYRMVVGGKPHTVFWGYPRTCHWLRKRKADELTILVEAAPDRPEIVRQSVTAVEQLLKELPEASYQRSGNGLSASVTFYLKHEMAAGTEAGIKRALEAIFSPYLATGDRT